MNLAHSDKSVYQVAVELNILSATTTVRFPCLFSVQWKTNNQKVNIETGKYGPQGSKTEFNQKLVMKTEIGYDKSRKCFLKKETQVQLNLTSKNKSDQPKLVGRVAVDLASILNEGVYSQPTQIPLQFCSVNASLIFSFRILQKIETDLQISELELSYGDSLSLNSALRLGVSTISKQKGKESVELGPDSGSANKNKMDFLQILKKQLISPLSPQSVDPVIKEVSTPKQSAIIKNDQRSIVQQKIVEIKPATRSFKNNYSTKQSTLSKKSEVSEDFQVKAQNKQSTFKKMGSMSSDISDGKLSEDLTKQKIENQKLKQQNDKSHYEGEQYKIQLQKLKQECDLLKLQARQKKMSLDQATNQATIYKAQLSKLKDEFSKRREQCVQLNLKLASMREQYNTVLLKSSSNERELAKLQSLNEKYQILRKQNEALTDKLIQCEADNMDLRQTLNNLDQMHQEALSKCNQHEEALGSHQDSNAVLRQKLANQTKDKLEYKQQVQNLNEKVKRLQQIAIQFEEAQSEWAKNLQMERDEASCKKGRIEQLEEGMIQLDSQIQSLSQQNHLLIQKCNTSNQEYEKIRTQKQLLQSTLHRQQAQIQSLQSEVNFHQQQKFTIQKELQLLQVAWSTLQKDYSKLQVEYSSLKQSESLLKKDNQDQSNNLMQLRASFEQLATKNNEMQELVLNVSELREKQREEFANNQRNLTLIIAQHQANNQQLTSILQRSTEKIVEVEEELKGRQNLILRLQQGLNTQVQRSEELSKRVMQYMDKQQRMKDTIVLVEAQCKKVSELLYQQESRQEQYISKLAEAQGQLQQLNFTCQQHIKCIQELQQSNRRRQASLLAQINNLSQQLQTKNTQISQLGKILSNKQAQIEKGYQSYLQLQSKLNEHYAEYNNLVNELNEIQNEKSRAEGILLIKQSAIQSLQNQVSSKLKELQTLQREQQGQSNELSQIYSQMKQRQAKYQSEMNEIQIRYEQLSNKYQQAEHDKIMKQQQHLQSINALQLQISQLKLNCEELTKQNNSFNINHYKEQIKSKTQEIRKLEVSLKNANSEINKIPTLERALKIKSIELSSLKFKGKGDGSEANQLLRLKDEQISSLRNQRDGLVESLRQLQDFKEKYEALTTQLQLLQQEKFSIESLSNERALQLDQLRQQNRNLMEEITIIGQRNGQLQKCLQDFALKNGSGNKIHASSQLQNLSFIYKSLIQIIDLRAKSKNGDKLAELIKNLANRNEESNKGQKSKKLSSEFQKIKVMILKNEIKGGQQEKAKLMTLFKDYEGLLNEVIN